MDSALICPLSGPSDPFCSPFLFLHVSPGHLETLSTGISQWSQPAGPHVGESHYPSDPPVKFPCSPPQPRNRVFTGVLLQWTNAPETSTPASDQSHPQQLFGWFPFRLCSDVLLPPCRILSSCQNFHFPCTPSLDANWIHLAFFLEELRSLFSLPITVLLHRPPLCTSIPYQARPRQHTFLRTREGYRNQETKHTDPTKTNTDFNTQNNNYPKKQSIANSSNKRICTLGVYPMNVLNNGFQNQSNYF